MNDCVDPKYQIPTEALSETLQSEQQYHYEIVVGLLLIYVIAYCVFIMPTSICLFRMQK